MEIMRLSLQVIRRWSQTYLPKGAKNGKRTVRQKTINFMPSRMQGGTLFSRGNDLLACYSIRTNVFGVN